MKLTLYLYTVFKLNLDQDFFFLIVIVVWTVGTGRQSLFFYNVLVKLVIDL